jgi:hypothetical protein
MIPRALLPPNSVARVRPYLCLSTEGNELARSGAGAGHQGSAQAPFRPAVQNLPAGS